MVQWLELGVFTAEGLVSIPGQGTEITQAVQSGQKKKKNPKTHSSKLAPPCAEPTVMMTDVCLAAPQTAQGVGVSLDPDSLRENLGTGALNSQVHS